MLTKIDFQKCEFKSTFVPIFLSQTYFAIWFWLTPEELFLKCGLVLLVADLLIMATYFKVRQSVKMSSYNALFSKADAKLGRTGGFALTLLLISMVFFLMYGPETRCRMLNAACLSGRLNAVKLLTRVGTDIDRINEDMGGTPLMVAAARGHLDVVKFLIQHNANVALKSKNGATALSLARMRKHKEIADALERAGAKY